MADAIVVFVVHVTGFSGPVTIVPAWFTVPGHTTSVFGLLDLSQVCSLLLSCSHHVKELCGCPRGGSCTHPSSFDGTLVLLGSSRRGSHEVAKLRNA